MAKLNILKLSHLAPVRTHEGGPAKAITPEQALRRSVLACMLWEDEFYEEGVQIAGRIRELVPKVDAAKVAALAIEAREAMKLRHVPLLLVREMARHASHRSLVAQTLARVIQRADELSEFMAIYWADGRAPLSGQVKKGLAAAFTKFDEYALAKYDRAGVVRLRDVLFLCHAKPNDADQAGLWRRLIEGNLFTPDTWEVALSGGGDKRAHWERLLAERKLGALALLRNLRNMKDAGVSEEAVINALSAMKTERVLPFRFLAAARYAPQWEEALEQAMYKADRRPGEACRPHCAAGRYFRQHGCSAGSPFGDAAHGCGVRTGCAASRSLRGSRGLQLLRQTGAGTVASWLCFARCDCIQPAARWNAAGPCSEQPAREV